MRRRQMKKQKRIIIISSLCLLLCLCVGYAAFQTTLSITAKGNIIDNSVDITDNVVTEGDGLYEDIYEEGRYVYRGQDPDNYIMFNDELWRIVAKEADGTYKIIRNDVLATRTFDDANHRSTANNSYCTDPRYGCGVYATVSGTFSSPSGSQSGTVTEDSSIKIYLNGDYYTNNINETAKGQMTSHSFNIGAVEWLNESGAGADSIEENIAGEKMYTWTGNVGLANVSDILKASINPSCTSASKVMNEVMSVSGSEDFSNPCSSNYLLDLPDPTGFWTINAFGSESGSVLGYSDSANAWCAVFAGGDGFVAGNFATNGGSYGARPVLYLKSDTTLNGSGTAEDPFTIV